MGQARRRKAEIEQLKASTLEIEFLAIRHCEDGQEEFFHTQCKVPQRPQFDKNSLLQYICLKDWLHTPPASAVAEYLIQTKTFEMFSDPKEYGYIINFYEVDKEITARKGQKSCSCRDIMIVPRHSMKAVAEAKLREHEHNPNMDIKFHA